VANHLLSVTPSFPMPAPVRRDLGNGVDEERRFDGFW
jgi:hypothetical protein